MSQVDSVTERSATAAEQLASTAEEMTAQAHALRDLVASFHKSTMTTTMRVTGAHGRGNGVAAPPAATAPTSTDPEFRPF